MSGLVLVVRPEPGASETAARARRLGLEPVLAPLFVVRPLTWRRPDPASFDAVLLTSANGARHADAAPFLRLPCHAVGEATAAAATAAGFAQVVTGDADGAAAVEAMARSGVARALHLCGRDHLALRHPAVTIERCFVYAADPADELPEHARSALARGAIALLHSPRAGAALAALVDRAGLARSEISIAAISDAAAAAAGSGWRRVAAAGRPRDEALLELVAQLCQNEDEAE